MNIPKHKTFISYRHPESLQEKELLIKLSDKYDIFDDYSIGKGDIVRSEFKDDDAIRKEIVSEWIKDATVTILLVSKNMFESKFIDWEMQATMSDNITNKKMGLICIITNQPNNNQAIADEDKDIVEKLSRNFLWQTLRSNQIESLFFDLPTRVKKNLNKRDVDITIITWNTLFSKGDQEAATQLKQLIDRAFNRRKNNNYDTSDKLQRTHK